ncbi:hypothetical protein [Curtobacterium flaccumfaciens]|uniref:hypothetical protein n=1 Tax=Curtobacterium flaccumfaciens TaxID=2035 RepID=UPI001125E0ED|nr:hypothetical protein [Curtobacterium flaccumfaciens]TPG03968.1 hypothetical protein EAH85_17900 [Curtobacterium flaccumfaciens]
MDTVRAEELAELLGSRVLYVPWGAESVSVAAELALELHSETGSSGRVLAETTTVIPEELLAWPQRTTVTRTAADATDVVAVIRPSYQLLEHLTLPTEGFAVVAEGPRTRLNEWAQFAGARNMVTGETLTARLTDTTQDAFDKLVASGSNGSTAKHSKTAANDAVSRLYALGVSRTQILGYLMNEQGRQRSDPTAPCRDPSS